ncbi:Sds3-like-domain-containing protein [Phlyctochytrium arcticum]|nr:Sds3-like-domain-containing protein [Phlyctochytrium arcticum]
MEPLSTGYPSNAVPLGAPPEPKSPVPNLKRAAKLKRPRDKPTTDSREKEERLAYEDEDLDHPLTKKERKHKEFQERLERLNRDFLVNKERIYQDKLASFNEDVQSITQGQHPEFVDILRVFERDRIEAMEYASYFKDYQLECANVIYEHEHDYTIAEYKREREALRERMLQVLDDKKRKLREDRENFDVHAGPHKDAVVVDPIEDQRLGTRKATRSHAARSEEKKDKRRKTQSLPGIVVSASDDAALHDLSIIRRAGFAAVKKSSTMSKVKK